MSGRRQRCQTTGGVSALLHLQSAPRRCEVLSWGYNRDTPSGKRDILATTMLCLLLIATAFAINGFTSALELVNVQTELCDTQEAKLADNRARMHNVTNYEAAFNATSYRVNLANDAFASANYTYNRLRTAFTWPEAYQLSEEERQVRLGQRVLSRLLEHSGGDLCYDKVVQMLWRAPHLKTSLLYFNLKSKKHANNMINPMTFE